MRDEEGRKKEASKVIQTTKQSNIAHVHRNTKVVLHTAHFSANITPTLATLSFLTFVYMPFSYMYVRM